MRTEEEVLTHFYNWADGNELIRAAVLTSSRVKPEPCTDILLDYDIELYVADLQPFQQDDDWLSVFGPIMVRWPRTELVQCFYGCKVLHGTLDGLVEKPDVSDLIEDIRVKAAENLHHARHYLLHPHDLSKVVHNFHYPFKRCFYALQSWMLLLNGKFYTRKDDLLDSLLDATDREVIRVARDWGELEQDREARPLYYIQLLERWSRNMLPRLAVYGDDKQDEVNLSA